jgi:alkanesulfonate monooxygenase SsuD/methylene tetrahydromethanopterin reductase-like flavin-dependent oxidoreductase (luciferase family)
VVGEDVVCDAVEGRFLRGGNTGALRAAAERAGRDGIDVLFLRDGPLGDAIVLASAVGSWVPGILLGVRIDLGTGPHRHPTLLAREMTTFDRVSGGRAVLAFTGPFTESTAEAVILCREMWTNGVAVGAGPHYPAAGAINRPLPERPGGPPIALDLTDGALAAPPPAGALLALCDLVLVPAGTDPPGALPPGVGTCEILDA